MSSTSESFFAAEYPQKIVSSSDVVHTIHTAGDTMRIMAPRVPDPDVGFLGEFCFGKEENVWYMYYCCKSMNIDNLRGKVDAASWVKVAMEPH